MLRTLPTTVTGNRRPGRRRRSCVAALALALSVVATLCAAGSAPAASAASAAPAAGEPGRVSVIKAEGLIDPVLGDFIARSVHQSEQAGDIAMVIQLDSSGSVISDADLAELADTIHNATIPVAVWVGPSGSEALGGAAQLAGAADLLGIAPGSRLGKTGPLVVDEDVLSPEFLAAAGRLESGTVNAADARKLGITGTRRAAVIGEFIIDLPGVETKVTVVEGRSVREPVSVPVFSALPLVDQLFHTVASPAAAYLLLLIGLSLIVFEFYTAGVGVAGLVGAGCFVLSCYGLAVLPVRPLGLALLVLAVFAYAIDVQTGVPRVWSVIASVALVAGSILVFDGLSLSWITLLVGIGGTALAMLAGMPAMVRTRFSTPTIGREWMIGEEGEAVSAVSPDGVVRIRGALWRARTNRATPIPIDDPVRVVEVQGLLLEVEPLVGGAVDHRERRPDQD